MNIKSICIFCGSKEGNNPEYRDVAIQLGKEMAKREVRLIYGGGSIGIMGLIADSVLEAGGKVTGVIPDFLASREVAHFGLNELLVVNSMHERKQKMEKLSDAFIALPGGFGTLEELAEVITWAQLGLVKKPIGILNIRNYFDLLVKQLDHMVAEGFLTSENRSLLIESNSVLDVINKLDSYEPPVRKKVIKTDQT